MPSIKTLKNRLIMIDQSQEKYVENGVVNSCHRNEYNLLQKERKEIVNILSSYKDCNNKFKKHKSYIWW